MSLSPQEVRQLLETLPNQYRGPAGAVAVLQDGEVIGQHVWGYADLERRIPLSADTPMPICSISKQMFCTLMLDLERNPTDSMANKGPVLEQMSNMLPQILPSEILQDTELTIDHLCDMQSGIRDYWALCMLCGAQVDSKFSIIEDGTPMLRKLKSLHFEPGTEFSYCNTNFYILGRLIEAVSKEPLANLLSERIFQPAGMKTAKLCPDTAKQPGPCIGYEGDTQGGFFRAHNAIEWSGDAGVVCSLKDMIAYERFFHSRWTDPQSGYRAAAEARSYKDGRRSSYRYGLEQGVTRGVATVGHSGALRGYRLCRVYAPKECLSVVVMFNHESDASNAAFYTLLTLLNRPKPTIPSAEPVSEWFGSFLDQSTQLAIRVSSYGKGKISVTYAGYPETLTLTDERNARSESMIARIQEDSLHIHCLGDNRVLNAFRISTIDALPYDESLKGSFYCEELESTFHCEGQTGLLYGAFDGYLGRGPANIMKHLGNDVWALACARGVDAPAPGDWTLVFKRDENGAAISVIIGCWLARRLEYQRM
ncbi:uncharacterized protein PV09_01948 [Verruconis gallopava]|uniref:Beta-lactamase-related domain-containing protein n=1 Tax=Verruconis gallopava TaxID=253628 RepID=A0A0D1Z2A7_9PEZI|nr:uncharacterized protein PV09_01948 [Verruconis gallopava]KIW07057.1 hypothetical protein PV09_01948 [Verruconis gallopava]